MTDSPETIGAEGIDTVDNSGGRREPPVDAPRHIGGGWGGWDSVDAPGNFSEKRGECSVLFDVFGGEGGGGGGGGHGYLVNNFS